MRQVDAHVQRRLVEKGLDISRIHMMVLKTVNHRGPQPQTDLAFITDRDKTSLVRLIDTMVRKGLVVRELSPTDKRVNLIKLTPKGLVKLKEAEPVVISIFEELQAGITEAERKVVLAAMQTIQDNACRDKDLCQEITTT